MNDARSLSGLQRLAVLLTDRAGIAPALLEGAALGTCVRIRMERRAIADLGEYVSAVESDQHELDSLVGEIAVPETWFFRYVASFEYLREAASRRLSAGGAHLKCASLGCATGVETWCIAATALSAGWDPSRVRVLGVDRSPDALASARRGAIPGGSLRQQLPAWSSPWIVRLGEGVSICAEVSSCVSFERFDLLGGDDLPGRPFDVIFCRNVMIYLDTAARHRLVSRLLEWLAPGGVLFLGHADGLVDRSRLEPTGPPGAFAWQRSSQCQPGGVRGMTSAPPRPAPRKPDGTHTKPSDPKPSAMPHPQPATAAPSAISSAPATAPLLAVVESLIAQREFSHAQRLLEERLRSAPATADLLEVLAGVLCSQDLLEPARQAYERLVYLEPRHGPALLALAELSEATGRPDAARLYRQRLERLEQPG